jgi:hypothetical protein
VYEVRPGIIETDVTRPVKARCDHEIADGLVPARRWGYPARPSWIHGRDSHAGENPPPKQVSVDIRRDDGRLVRIQGRLRPCLDLDRRPHVPVGCVRGDNGVPEQDGLLIGIVLVDGEAVSRFRDVRSRHRVVASVVQALRPRM